METTIIMGNISKYLSGNCLYGDDLSIEGIAEWFEHEKEGFANLGAKNRAEYRYGYRWLDWLHGNRYLGSRRFPQALGLGSAYGDEFIPLANRIDAITILEPSDAFDVRSHIGSVSCRYVKPVMNGIMPFEDTNFDLITCLSVLHHIPNVSTVIGECYRCLKSGGIMLVRDPITSMGDWTKPRRGLTKYERGIPLDIYKRIILQAGFNIQRCSLCIFPAIPKVMDKLKIDTYNNLPLTILDAVLCRLMRGNTRYHRPHLWEKFGPGYVYFVLTKG